MEIEEDSQKNNQQEEIIELKFPKQNKNLQNNNQEQEEEIKFLCEQKKPVFIQNLQGNCTVCQSGAKYKCPKCKAFYCKLECYRAHSQNCTEEFYQEQVISEMKGKLVTKDESKKMKNILHDYKDMPNQQDISMEEQNEQKKLKRLEELAKLDINNLDFAKLTLEDQESFKQFLQESQQETGVIQQWVPFWQCQEGIFSLFVEEINEENQENQENQNQNSMEEEQDQENQKNVQNETIQNEEEQEEILEGQMLQELEEFDKKLAQEIDDNFKEINQDLGEEAVNKDFSKEELFGDDKDAEKEYNEYYQKLRENQEKLQKQQEQQNKNQNINNNNIFQNENNSINNNEDDENDIEQENENIDYIQKHKIYRQKMKAKCKAILNLQKLQKNNENLNYHLINIIYSLIVSYQYFNGDYYSDEMYNFFLSICECIGESKIIFQSESNAINLVIETSARNDSQSVGILQESVKDLIDVLKNKFFIVEILMHFYDIVHDKQEQNLKKEENTIKDMKRHRKQRQQLNKMKQKLIYFLSYAKNIPQENLDGVRVNVQNYHTEMQNQKSIVEQFKQQKKLIL